jgi:hypothetical protein
MKLYGWIGLLLLITSEYCLYRRIEPFTTWFYCFAWWSYILLADNLLLKLRGRSLLNNRRTEFWGMLPLSVFIWLLFEAYNFVIRNWSYNVAPPQIWQRWPGYALAFSTVLPGIFITSDLVEPLFGSRSGNPASECEILSSIPSTRPSALLVILGLLLSFAPLVWPQYFFAAVWLGPIFLLDPLLERVGIRSLSLGISSGDRRRIWSLMLGGLICGIIWEFWNFWAGSKWTYSVPFFGHIKIFEMPVLGFLGFPPFALECWIFYHLLKAIPRQMESSAARISWWISLGIVSITIIWGIDAHTVVRFAEQVFHHSSGGG